MATSRNQVLEFAANSYMQAGAFHAAVDDPAAAARVLAELEVDRHTFLCEADATGADFVSLTPFAGGQPLEGAALDRVLAGFLAEASGREERQKADRARNLARHEAEFAARRRRRADLPADRATAIRGKDRPRRFRLVSAGSPTIAAASGAGRLPTFSGVAYTGAPMRPEGWHQPVILDLGGLKVPRNQHRPVLRQHDHLQLLGHTTLVEVSRAGILVEGVFSGLAKDVEPVTGPAGNGFEWQLSVGANPVVSEFLPEGEKIEVNGRTLTGPLTISRETELGEISFVPLGADGDTTVSIGEPAA